MVLVAQTLCDSASVLEPLRDLVQAKDKDVPIFDVHTVERFYEAHTTLAVVAVRLIGTMGVLGIGLTMIGLYGLVSYAVSRRTREIGIRMAVGAAKVQISGMMLRQGMVPVWIGLVMGSALSFATLAILPSIIPVVERYDARFHFLVFPALILTTGLAALIPSNRASQVDPAVALRAD